MTVHIGISEVGDGAPISVIAEIGPTHNGSVDTAVPLIDVGADALTAALGVVMVAVQRLVRDIRVIDEAGGEGVRRTWPGELASPAQL